MASSVKGMTIDIGGDTSKLQAALKALNKPISQIQSELRSLSNSLKLDPGNTVLLTNKQQLLAKQITETKTKIETLKGKLKELNDIQARGGTLTEEQQNNFRKLSTELAAAEINLKNLNKQYAEFGSVGLQKIKTVGESMKTLGSSIQEVGKKLSVASAAMSGLLVSGVKYTADIQKVQAGLKVATGSAEEAEKVMAQIKQDAKTTPFDVKGLAQANQLLLSTGIDAEEARDVIMSLGDAVAASGGGNDELSRMAYNLQQVKNLGKASSVDIKQFGMAGIDIYGILADYLGITKEQAAETEVTFEDLSGALKAAASEGGKYFGGMAEQSKTLYGRTSNLKDSFNEFTSALAENLIPIVEKVLQTLTNLLNKYNELSPQMKSLISTIAIIVAALAPFLIILGNLVTVLGTLVVSFALVGIAISAISAPVLAIVAVIGVLIGIFVKLWTTNEEFRNNVTNIWNAIMNFFKGVVLPMFYSFFGSWINAYKTAFTTVVGIIKGLLNNATIIINGVIGVFSGVITYLQGVFTGNWRQAWEGIKNIFVSIINAIKGLFGGFINDITSKINAITSKINSISIAGHSVNIPQIPGLATGGIVRKPTLAMVGEGGSSEAVIPLDRLPNIMAEAMRGVSGNSITIYTQELDSQKLEQIVTYVNRRFGAAI